jgi:hypothetical protein
MSRTRSGRFPLNPIDENGRPENGNAGDVSPTASKIGGAASPKPQPGPATVLREVRYVGEQVREQLNTLRAETEAARALQAPVPQVAKAPALHEGVHQKPECSMKDKRHGFMDTKVSAACAVECTTFKNWPRGHNNTRLHGSSTALAQARCAHTQLPSGSASACYVML